MISHQEWYGTSRGMLNRRTEAMHELRLRHELASDRGCPSRKPATKRPDVCEWWAKSMTSVDDSAWLK